VYWPNLDEVAVGITHKQRPFQTVIVNGSVRKTLLVAPGVWSRPRCRTNAQVRTAFIAEIEGVSRGGPLACPESGPPQELRRIQG